MGADSPRLSSAPIQAVFIGGGTPTSLSPENAGRLLSTIQRCLPLANDYELTFEGRVHDLVPEKMDVWFRNGVNRMSLGVQSFDTKVRQAVGRIDDGETVFSHLQELLSYSQCAVVIDLMYGLPYQTMDVWHKDVETLVESGIDGADLYQLNVFEHSDLNLAIPERETPSGRTDAGAVCHVLLRQELPRRTGIQAPQFLPLGKEQQGAEPLQYAGPLRYAPLPLWLRGWRPCRRSFHHARPQASGL